MGDIVHEVEAARGRRRARDHAARPERQLVRPRPRRRAVPAAVRRPAARARRGRRSRSHPLHVAAPEGPAPGDDRGDGGVRVGVRAPAPAAPGGERPHARAHAPRLHRRALPHAARGRARRDPRPRRHHRSHRRLPRRDRRRLRAHARGRRHRRVRRRVHVRVLAAAGYAGGRHDRRLRAVRRRAGTHAAVASTSSSATRSRSTKRASGVPSRSWSRDRRSETPRSGRVALGRTSSCTSSPTPANAPASPATVRITRAAPHLLRGDLVDRRVRIPVTAAPA